MDGIRRKIQSFKCLTNSLRLLTAAVVEISLGRAIIDLKIGRVTEPWCQSVTKKDHSTAGLECIFEADDLSLSLQELKRDHADNKKPTQLPMFADHPMYTPASILVR